MPQFPPHQNYLELSTNTMVCSKLHILEPIAVTMYSFSEFIPKAKLAMRSDVKQPIRLLEPSSAYANDQLLQQIATALGLPVEALFTGPGELVFYANAEGTRWAIAIGEAGSLIVRRIAIHNSDHASSDETVAGFLVRNLETDQGEALAALIDQVLMTHIQRTEGG